MIYYADELIGKHAIWDVSVKKKTNIFISRYYKMNQQ